MPTVLDGRLRAEWPVAPHVLHTNTCRSSGDAITSRYRFSLRFLLYARPVFSVSGQLGRIAPEDPALLCIANTWYSKRVVFRWLDLPHALHRGLGHCASLWPCSWQCSHTSSLYTALLHMCFVSTRAAYAGSLGWALARRMASCTACAAFGMGTSLFAGDAQIARTTYGFCLRAESACSVRFGSAASATRRWCGLVTIRRRVRFVPSRSGLARTSASSRCP